MTKGTTHQVASLIHAASVREAEEREQASTAYAKLIHANAGTAADVKELMRCAAMLGKTSTDIKADHNVILQAEQLAEEIIELTGAATAETEIAELIEPNYKSTTEQVERLQRQHQVLVNVVMSMASSYARSFKTKRERLVEMKSANPSLLAGVVVPDVNLDNAPADAAALVSHYAEWKAAKVELRAVSPGTPESVSGSSVDSSAVG